MLQIIKQIYNYKNIVIYILFITSLFFSCTSTGGMVENNFTDNNKLTNFPRKSYMEENINGDFPDIIYIKTRTQTFNTYHYYILQDGHIWYKGVTDNTGPKEWTIFRDTGLPNNKEEKNFVNPNIIVEISADADELVAICDKGRTYRIFFDKTLSIFAKRDVWLENKAWPQPETFILNDRIAQNISWSFGKRNSHVLYYEDIFGNGHHWGTMGISTVYYLLADGQEIVITDTGLPADFSHNLIGPERGTFKAAAISASASTMFLINEAGEMYTRLADFDTIGSDPMFFKYTYVPYKSNLKGTDYRSNYSLWGLPSEDWLYQPQIPLAGKAALTRRITILQNGIGNSARELRVGGLNEKGETGYWSKPIFDNNWTFVPVHLNFSKSDFLNKSTFSNKKELRGKSLDTSMRGFIWENNVIIPDWEFEVKNFNILEGSCTLNIKRKNESCSIILHPVELWTYYKRNQPGRDGTPKNFFITIEIPEGELNNISEEFKNVLDNYLVKDNLKLFSYIMEATTEYIFIQKRENSKRNFTLFLTNGISPNTIPVFHRIWNIADMTDMDIYHSDKLMLTGGPEYDRNNYAEIKQKIIENENFKKDIEKRIKDYSKSLRKASTSRAAYSTFNALTHITFLYLIDFPKIYTVSRFGNSIMKTSEISVNLISGTRIWVDKKLLEMIDLRIEAYEEMAEELKSGKSPVILPPNFSETCIGYWELAKLPKKMRGEFVLFAENITKSTAYLKPDLIESDFPGWIINIGEGETGFTVMIELNEPLTIISERYDIPASDKPYVFKGNLFIVSTSFNEDTKELYSETIEKLYNDKGIPVKIHWNGKEFLIRSNAISDGAAYTNIFRGTIDDSK